LKKPLAPVAAIGIASVFMMLSFAISSAAGNRSVIPRVPTAGSSRGAPAHDARIGRRGIFLRSRTVAMGCTSDFGTAGDYFVGLTDGAEDDFASQNGAGVVAGQKNESCGVDSTVGGGDLNTIAVGANLNFIGAGNNNVTTGVQDFTGAGFYGEVDGSGSAIVAGGRAYDESQGNPSTPGNDVTGNDSFVGAGDLNNVTGAGSFIGAGGSGDALSGSSTPGNSISGDDSFIGAGDRNVISGQRSFIGSGFTNSVASTNSFVGGGESNRTGSGSTFATIAGGENNDVTGEFAAILGGFGNTASGEYATVPGGNSDTASGTLSFAAGYHANAGHDGSFVWSDYRSGSAPVSDSGINQFVARASGGVYLYSNEAATSGVELAPGSGAWAMLSDRNAKTNVVPIDDASVLAKIASLPVTTWQYKSERGIRHAGPMAQDFYAAFKVGEDDRHITSVDEDGVALAAIKALNAMVQAQRARLMAKSTEIAVLRSHLAQVDRSNANLNARFATLEAKVAVLSRGKT
jgi:Chaperone of endosialidase